MNRRKEAALEGTQGDRRDRGQGARVEGFVEGRTPGRAKRIRSALGRLGKMGVPVDLEDVASIDVEALRVACSRLRARYAEASAAETLKHFRAFLAFELKEGRIAKEQLTELLDSAGGHVLQQGRARSTSALFPRLLEECEHYPEPRASRDAALVALWGATKLSWSELAGIEPRGVGELLLMEPGLGRWVQAWARRRGDQAGPFLCRLNGAEVRVGQGQSAESLRQLVDARLRAAGGPRVGLARESVRRSFRRWA